jgi:hypothetical protein
MENPNPFHARSPALSMGALARLGEVEAAKVFSAPL